MLRHAKLLTIIVLTLGANARAQSIPLDARRFLDACESQKPLAIEQIERRIRDTSKLLRDARRRDVAPGPEIGTGFRSNRKRKEPGEDEVVFPTREAKRAAIFELESELRRLGETRRMILKGEVLVAPTVNVWDESSLAAGQVGRLAAPQPGTSGLSKQRFEVVQIIAPGDMLVQARGTIEVGPPSMPQDRNLSHLLRVLGVDTSSCTVGSSVDLGQLNDGVLYDIGMPIYNVVGSSTLDQVIAGEKRAWVIQCIEVEPWASDSLEE